MNSPIEVDPSTTLDDYNCGETFWQDELSKRGESSNITVMMMIIVDLKIEGGVRTTRMLM